MKPRKIETIIGVASVILALSPFKDHFKAITITDVLSEEVTAYHLYFGYAVFFALYILVQLYIETAMNNTTNQSRRISYQKILIFGYFLLLMFPPIMILNLLISNIILAFDLPIDEKSVRTGSVIFIVILSLWICVDEYRNKFHFLDQTIALKEEIREKLLIADQLLGRDKLIEVALLHYDISIEFLRMMPWGNEGTITDRATEAFKKKKITSKQKDGFQTVATIWDHARLTEKNEVEAFAEQLSGKVIENHVFLQSNIARYCE